MRAASSGWGYGACGFKGFGIIMERLSSQNETTSPFNSLAALQLAHSNLLELYTENHADKISEDFKTKIIDFVERAIATGTILNFDEDRADAQTYLNYWTTVLYDAGESPAPSILKRFDKELANKKSGDTSPYRGLKAFDKEDRNNFFGRRRLIQEMTELVRQKRFLAVVGLSGSGKSSLVRAGFLPTLESGAIKGSENWLYLEPVLPGYQPLQSLINIISTLDKEAIKKSKEQTNLFLTDDNYLSDILNNTGKTVVLTVDQFEELFTLAIDEDEKKAFVANLVNLVKNPQSRHIFILTMRSEFDISVARYQELQELFDSSQVRVTSLSITELRNAIEKPAEQRGVVFEKDLVEELAQRVKGEPAGLPLLQFTLQKLWENRVGTSITWAKYTELGGSPKTILANVADKTYDSFKLKEDENLSRLIFLRLVRPKAGLGEVTSNREKRETLLALGPEERVNSVLKLWENAGLLKITYAVEGQVRDGDLVQITHEALIRNWGRLVDWIELERGKLHKRLLLSAAAEQWSLHKNDPNVGGLLGGSALAEALTYDDLTEQEKEFIKASEEAELEIEQRKEKERKVKIKAASFLLIFSLLLFIIAVVIVQSATQKAQTAKEIAENANVEYQGYLAKREELLKQNEYLEKVREKLSNQSKAFKKQAFINPGILIQDGQFQTDSEIWKAPLEEHRAEIETATRSVGRLASGEQNLNAYGTASVIADGVVVAPAYMMKNGKLPENSFVDFRETVDFTEKLNSAKSFRFALKRVINTIQNTDPIYNLVLVEIEKRNGRGESLPPPLPLIEEEAFKFESSSEVYVIGYPARDNKVSPILLTAVFQEIFGVKRIQPGFLLSDIDLSVIEKKERIKHNCFTVAGNGGSPLFDLKTGKVIGIHIGGNVASGTGQVFKEATPISYSMIQSLFSNK
jgi:type II secretory pathway predicted ATPase ExeA